MSDKNTPLFHTMIRSDSVKILFSSTEYCNFIKEKLKKAKNRINLMTLYIGNGEIEDELLDIICSQKDNGVKVMIILDKNRSCRSGPIECNNNKNNTITCPDTILMNSISMIEKHNLSIFTRLFSPNIGTPSYIGRMNGSLGEMLGVSHMKLLVCDDIVIITGANLSEKYLTSTIDRYIVIEDKQTANFLSELIEAIWDEGVTTRELQNPEDMDIVKLDESIRNVFERYNNKQQNSIEDLNISSNRKEQIIEKNFQLSIGLQFGRIGMYADDILLHDLLKNGYHRITFVSAYMNPPNVISKLLENASVNVLEILHADVTSNSFYEGKFPLGIIPYMYESLINRFISKLIKLKLRRKIKENVNFKEEEEEVEIYRSHINGNFHAKGFWFLDEYNKVKATIFGSSNFGCRSRIRDMDITFSIIGSDLSSFQMERENILSKCRKENFNKINEESDIYNSIVENTGNYLSKTIIDFLSYRLRNFL